MFDKTQAAKSLDVIVFTTDGRELQGFLQCGFGGSLGAALNGEGQFIELQDAAGQPVFLAKTQIASIEPTKNGGRALPALATRATEHSNWNRVLGVSPQADRETVQQAYHALAKQYHPDVYSGSTPDEIRRYAGEMFTRINQAYEQYQGLKLAA